MFFFALCVCVCFFYLMHFLFFVSLKQLNYVVMVSDDNGASSDGVEWCRRGGVEW